MCTYRNILNIQVNCNGQNRVSITIKFTFWSYLMPPPPLPSPTTPLNISFSCCETVMATVHFHLEVVLSQTAQVLTILFGCLRDKV